MSPGAGPSRGRGGCRGVGGRYLGGARREEGGGVTWSWPESGLRRSSTCPPPRRLTPRPRLGPDPDSARRAVRGGRDGVCVCVCARARCGPLRTRAAGLLRCVCARVCLCACVCARARAAPHLVRTRFILNMAPHIIRIRDMNSRSSQKRAILFPACGKCHTHRANISRASALGESASHMRIMSLGSHARCHLLVVAFEYINLYHIFASLPPARCGSRIFFYETSKSATNGTQSRACALQVSKI